MVETSKLYAIVLSVAKKLFTVIKNHPWISIGIFFLSVWGYAMLAKPLYIFWQEGHSFDYIWPRIQAIWYDWQTYNAGMIALLAALVGLIAVHHKEEEQRKRNFIAAMLPMPNLTSKTLERCSHYIGQYMSHITSLEIDVSDGYSDFKLLDQKNSDLLKEVARYAPNEISAYLARILALIQIVEARAINQELKPKHCSDQTMRLAYIYVMFEHILEYSRDKMGHTFMSKTPESGDLDNILKRLKDQWHIDDEALNRVLTHINPNIESIEKTWKI